MVRAGIACLALYALVLQAFLGGLAPRFASLGPDHAALCAPGGDAPAGRERAAHDALCCLSACAAGPLGALPAPDGRAAPAPPVQVARVDWRPVVHALRPPVRAGPATARGPPVA